MTAARQPLYQRSVFINCPFDGEYLPVFRAIIFTVSACGFDARSTLEHDDGSQVRIEKIYRLIGSSAFGIHDISRTELDDESQLPRFNMPLELGVFLGQSNLGPGGTALNGVWCWTGRGIDFRDSFRHCRAGHQGAWQQPGSRGAYSSRLAAQCDRPRANARRVTSVGQISEIHNCLARHLRRRATVAVASDVSGFPSFGVGVAVCHPLSLRVSTRYFSCPGDEQPNSNQTGGGSARSLARRNSAPCEGWFPGNLKTRSHSLTLMQSVQRLENGWKTAGKWYDTGWMGPTNSSGMGQAPKQPSKFENEQPPYFSGDGIKDLPQCGHSPRVMSGLEVTISLAL